MCATGDNDDVFVILNVDPDLIIRKLIFLSKLSNWSLSNSKIMRSDQISLNFLSLVRGIKILSTGYG
jgi:hypothetical protein